MKDKCYATVIIEYEKGEEETFSDALETVKSNIEHCLGKNSVKYIAVCNEDGEQE